MTDKDTKTDIEKIRNKGVTLVHFEGNDRKVIDVKMAEVNDKWAKDLDGRGKPGTEVLEAFRSALKGQ